MASERVAGTVGQAASVAPALAGIVASAMLAVDYLRVVPLFCEEGGGCDALKHTAYAMPFGIPMPFFGLAGFLGLGVVALLEGRRARVVQLAMGSVAALAGVVLLTLQLQLRHFCPFCCVADTCGILSGGIAFVRWRRLPLQPAPRVLSYVSALGLVVAFLVPLGVGLQASPVPSVIRKRRPPRRQRGEVTIVDTSSTSSVPSAG